MPKDIVSQCISWGYKQNVSILLYTQSMIYVKNLIDQTRIKLKKFGVPYRMAHGDMQVGDIFKISYFKTDGGITALQAQIHLNNIQAVISNKYMIDITNAHTSKGSALKLIQNLYKIGADATCSFGDSENDIDMFKNSFFSYAMGNAPEYIKKQALHIAPTNNELGVVSILRQLFLIEK